MKLGGRSLVFSDEEWLPVMALMYVLVLTMMN